LGKGKLSLMRFLLIKYAAIILFMSFNVFASDHFHVKLNGCVSEPKILTIQKHISLFDILQAAEIKPCAFLFATSWLKSKLKPKQSELKKSLLNRLDHAKRLSLSSSEKVYVNSLFDLISSQPVTGRVPNTDMDFFHVEVRPMKNRMIVSEATFYFPKRPQTVHLIGFSTSQVAYHSEWDINRYIKTYISCTDCQPGWIWLVHSNASVQKVKVGLWTNEKYYISPGGWVISPLNYASDLLGEDFYSKLARWLATQMVK